MKRESISKTLRRQVFERDHHTCRYCGDQEGPFHADHVYPLSKGGETTLQNLVTACRSCNRRKSNKIGIWPNPILRSHKTKETHINSNPVIHRGLVIVLAGLQFLVLSSLQMELKFSPVFIGLPGALVILVGTFFLLRGA